MPAPLTEATAIRLFNSVVAGAAAQQEQQQPILTQTQAQLQQHEHDDQAQEEYNNAGSMTQTEVPIQTEVQPTDQFNDSAASVSTGAAATTFHQILPTNASHQSSESVQSANEFGNSCRICRWNRSDMKIIHCPCKCKGSVGFIHMKCLKRWIVHRRDNRCEVCNSPFEIAEERVSFKQMLRTFWCAGCCGLILKHLLFSASLMPLAHVILQQVLQCMDSLNQGTTDQLTVQEVFVASCALLTSSSLFFHFFEFVTTRFILIRNILRHWWMFGSTSDFALIDIDEDSIDLF